MNVEIKVGGPQLSVLIGQIRLVDMASKVSVFRH